ncbi:LysR family transcriptional regulator [Bacillus sp. SM2101]|uniref:LysR family transcriptional regulator n=1 Tax=Bacillus sp. SM2101 TaxID=2805366 RepID=UPI001BDDD244|nr:LysR family transcriptional regulator [Bacillus sp. SM2101]
MDIRWLQTFIVAAKYQNFRITSEKLFMAQPTVTFHIQNLERYLGATLFSKKGRNIELTSTGMKFLPYAINVVQSLEIGIDELESWRQGYNRKLTIATSPLIAASILPNLLRVFIKKHREIEIAVKVMESEDIATAVKNREVDIGLSRKYVVDSSLQITKIIDDPVVLVIPHDGWDFDAGIPFDIEEIINNYLIFTHNHPDYWEGLLHQLRDRYAKMRRMEVTQVNVTKRFIEEGLGISFLPRSTIIRETLEGRLLEVEVQNFAMPKAATYLIVNHSESDEVLLFKDSLIHFYHGNTKNKNNES